MEGLGNVQQKISCIFKTIVVEETSSKRPWQPYKVVASEELRQAALEANIHDSLPSEKLDGTCVCVEEFEGQPWLWARLDKKPNKMADKRFKKFQSSNRAWQVSGKPEAEEPVFSGWDVDKDFKSTPPCWIPASGVPLKDGIPQPDDNGHIPGWTPVDPISRTHCWHCTSVNLEDGIALVLKTHEDDNTELEIMVTPLSELVGTTLELIGTHVNGNPYGLGTKQRPLHLLVRHGAISFQKKPPLDYQHLKSWFEDESEGQVEGIVWHCSNGQLFKFHRHHVGLSWPPSDHILRLNSKVVHINVDLSNYENDFPDQSAFPWLWELNGSRLQTLKGLAQ